MLLPPNQEPAMTTKTKSATKSAAPAADSAHKAAAKAQTKAAKTQPAKAAVTAPAKDTKAAKPPKEEKPKKAKMVRDSFTMPENDYSKIGELKKRCLQAGVHVKKSELLRAGLIGLSALPDAALVKAVEQLERIKTGRPPKP
jgi:hypothetical protein